MEAMTMADPSTGIKTLREHREALGWSQVRVAANAGASPVTIGNIERSGGKDMPWSGELMRRVADALGVKVTDVAEFREVLGL